MNAIVGNKFATLVTFVVVSIVVSGYFIGIQGPMTPEQGPMTREQGPMTREQGTQQLPVDPGIRPTNAAAGDDFVIPATHYAEIDAAGKGPNQGWSTSLATLHRLQDQMVVDEWQEKPIQISPAQKSFALAMRETIRSFNGAPPTVPHPVDQLTAESCIVCHGIGIRTETMRIPKMSHPYLANCTQCHVESNPTHMAAELFRNNSFVGLPAPSGGPRAFAEAPPMIPHSTWMRNECVSCHGPTGNFGIRSTHPWRKNCQQCHAPASKLDQVPIDSKPLFLPPPIIKK